MQNSDLDWLILTIIVIIMCTIEIIVVLATDPL